MAFFLQYRQLKHSVVSQLDTLKDQEKGPTPRLSGSTTHVPIEKSEKDRSDDDEDAPYAALDGITRDTKPNGDRYYLVNFMDHDSNNPRTWSTSYRLRTTLILVTIAFIVTAASAIDSAVAVQAAEAFHVSEVTEALAGTGIFLVAFGLGGLFAAPASEMLGRWPIYVISLAIFGCWLIGSALTPNVAGQIVFRALAGFFASTPLTVAGGSMSDMWTIKERTWSFPVFAVIGFGGPVLGPVIASYIGTSPHVSFRWTEWVMLIGNGVVVFLVIAFMRETSPPRLLQYKARMLRKLTGEEFLTQAEAAGHPLSGVLKKNFTRPFILALEPIVLAYTLYLTVVYIILFTFLDGYPYIFEMTYDISQGLSNLCFIGLFIGILLAYPFMVPLVQRVTYKQLARDGDDGTGAAINQETRTIFSMIGAPLIPIGLFWMGWTDYAHISIWSPLIASAVIGLGIVSIFMSAYMYIIDSYEAIAASALTFAALVRYLAAGGMTVVGIPMYKNLGTHVTLSMLGGISAIIVPIPYILYLHGAKLRKRSKYAVSRDNER